MQRIYGQYKETFRIRGAVQKLRNQPYKSHTNNTAQRMLNLTTESDFTRNLRRQRSSCFLKLPLFFLLYQMLYGMSSIILKFYYIQGKSFHLPLNA